MSKSENKRLIVQLGIMSCPFCGKYPEIYNEENLADENDKSEYECVCISDSCKDRMVVAFGETRGEAIHQWNDRVWDEVAR